MLFVSVFYPSNGKETRTVVRAVRVSDLRSAEAASLELGVL